MPNLKIPSGVISPNWTIQQDANGNLGIYKNGTEVGYFDSAGGITWLVQETSNPTSTFSIFRASGGGGYFLINLPNPANNHFAVAFNGTNALEINPNGLSAIGNVGTGAGGGTTFGVPLTIQVDKRAAVSSTDSSPITLASIGFASELWRVTAHLEGNSGTITSAVYTITFTEAGTTYSRTLSISAVHTETDGSWMFIPDNGSNITVQLTTLAGTSATVNVSALAERIS